jgi:hypothetical protein
VDGECADIFLAGKRTAALPDSLHHRSCGDLPQRTPLDRRNRIHVRSSYSAVDSIAESVSRSDTAIAALGYYSSRLRRARLEISDADRVDCSSDQLFLASVIRCELGSWPLLSRTARSSRTHISVGLPDHCSRLDLLPHASLPALVCWTLVCRTLVWGTRQLPNLVVFPGILSVTLWPVGQSRLQTRLIR